MPNYRRYYIENSLIFITNVTLHRKPILLEEDNVNLFWHSLEMVKDHHPFNLLAYVILPDHFHWLISMPQNDPNFSRVLLSFKWNYTLNYKKLHEIHAPFHIWQRGFLDHVIRNEKDLEAHVDYIHYNPVKHKLVDSPEKWQFSSYRDWEENGLCRSGTPV